MSGEFEKTESRKWSKVTREFTRIEEEKGAEIIKERKSGKENKEMEAQDFKPKVQVTVLSKSGAGVRNTFERMAEIQRAAKT